LGWVVAAACSNANPAPSYIEAPVQRRDIVVTASAAGTVQPLLTVDVKSQASGAVTDMRAQTGDDVHRGQLLAVIDPRLPKNALDQAQANLAVAQAQLENAKIQLGRQDTLVRAQVSTRADYEAASLAFAQAQAGLVNAQANLQDAQIAYEQTRVTAPMAGTIIEKDVELGTVISSPTRDVSGGTLLFKMANLDTVQVQAMVDETDIAKVQPGLPVTITVDAYPGRRFEGSVLKIEPQAQVQQNVTIFPVLVDIDNPGHVLKPGMNTEVEVHVAQRDDVLAVPVAALRTPRDIGSAALVLGLDSQAVERELAASAGAPAPMGEGWQPPREGPSREGEEADSAGASYVVFALRGGRPTPVEIRTGLTDLDYMEVTSGLTDQDTVLVLPSTSLLEAQQSFQQRVQNVTGGGLPGLRQGESAGRGGGQGGGGR
jgi:HlyD family secretion protein